MPGPPEDKAHYQCLPRFPPNIVPKQTPAASRDTQSVQVVAAQIVLMVIMMSYFTVL